MELSTVALTIHKTIQTGSPMSLYLAHRNEFPNLMNLFGIETAVEVGVGCGHFASVLLRSTSLKTLYLVDNWLNPADAQHREEARKLARENLQRVILLEKESTVAALSFLPQYVDLVYIDTSHFYRDAFRDFRAWFPIARRVFSGHDYSFWNPAANCPVGVVQAIEELAWEKGLQINVTGCKDSSFESRMLMALRASQMAGGTWGEDIPSFYLFLNRE